MLTGLAGFFLGKLSARLSKVSDLAVRRKLPSPKSTYVNLQEGVAPSALTTALGRVVWFFPVSVDLNIIQGFDNNSLKCAILNSKRSLEPFFSLGGFFPFIFL